MAQLWTRPLRSPSRPRWTLLTAWTSGQSCSLPASVHVLHGLHLPCVATDPVWTQHKRWRPSWALEVDARRRRWSLTSWRSGSGEPTRSSAVHAAARLHHSCLCFTAPSCPREATSTFWSLTPTAGSSATLWCGGPTPTSTPRSRTAWHRRSSTWPLLTWTTARTSEPCSRSGTQKLSRHPGVLQRSLRPAGGAVVSLVSALNRRLTPLPCARSTAGFGCGRLTTESCTAGWPPSTLCWPGEAKGHNALQRPSDLRLCVLRSKLSLK